MNDAHGQTANLAVIRAELAWLEECMTVRLTAFGAGSGAQAILPPPQRLTKTAGSYARAVAAAGLDADARLMLALALAPHLAPALLDPFFLQNQATGRRFTEFGGVPGTVHGGFLPTLETALFLMAGDDRVRRWQLEARLAATGSALQSGLILLGPVPPGEPANSAALRIPAPVLARLVQGDVAALTPGPEFPARPITTPLDWDDLVLDQSTRDQVELVAGWVRHEDTLMKTWGLARRLKPGFRCLFHGPPGTGKTLTATLLGKRFNIPVYRVDLSLIMSKWIGETEKNLAQLFDQAAEQRWILFFDEADSLFGKRNEAQSANDHFANQQIAYLLQRLEDFPGLAILATNQRNHLDEAFARRFQSSVRFAMPDAESRERLWRECFSGEAIPLSPRIDFAALAEAHELAGGAIINVLRYACLLALERMPPHIEPHDLLDGIRRELQKDGRYVSQTAPRG